MRLVVGASVRTFAKFVAGTKTECANVYGRNWKTKTLDGKVEAGEESVRNSRKRRSICSTPSWCVVGVVSLVCPLFWLLATSLLSPLGVRRKGGFYLLNVMLSANFYNYPTNFLITYTELGDTLHDPLPSPGHLPAARQPPGRQAPLSFIALVPPRSHLGAIGDLITASHCRARLSYRLCRTLALSGALITASHRHRSPALLLPPAFSAPFGLVALSEVRIERCAGWV